MGEDDIIRSNEDDYKVWLKMKDDKLSPGYERVVDWDKYEVMLVGPPGDDGVRMVSIRPRREQTGWICRPQKGCSLNCVAPKAPDSDSPNIIPSRCVYGPDFYKDCSNWQPFYGEVKE